MEVVEYHIDNKTINGMKDDEKIKFLASKTHGLALIPHFALILNFYLKKKHRYKRSDKKEHNKISNGQVSCKEDFKEFKINI